MGERSTEQFDVWLCGVDEGTAQQLALGMVAELDVEPRRTAELVRATPRVVRRRVARERAEKVARVLRELGASVEVRPSAPALAIAPGGRPERPSQPVAAAPPLSLPPVSPSEAPRAPIATVVQPSPPAPQHPGFSWKGRTLGGAAIGLFAVALFVDHWGYFAVCVTAGLALGVWGLSQVRVPKV